MAVLANDEPDPVTQQITDTLQSQSQAIMEVAEALKSLKGSLVSAVTDSIAQQRQFSQAAVKAEDPEATEDAAPENKVLPQEAWDDIRNAFLASHGEEVASGTDDSQTTLQSSQTIQAETKDDDAPDISAPIEVEEPELDLPEFDSISNPHALDEDELRTVVIDQERTISTLVRRLQKKSRAAQAITQEQLEEIAEKLPEQLQQKVAETLQALNNQHRYAELELSLERARVSRQASQLEVNRERLDARARAMGLEISDTGAISGGDGKAQRGSKARNWLGAMGFGN